MIDDPTRIALRPERVHRLFGYAFPVGAIAGSSSLVALTVFVMLESGATSPSDFVGPVFFAALIGLLAGLVAALVVVLLETIVAILFAKQTWHLLRGFGEWTVLGIGVGAASGATLLFLFVALGRGTSGVGGHETSLIGATLAGLFLGGLFGSITGALVGWIKGLTEHTAPPPDERADSRHTMNA